MDLDATTTISARMASGRSGTTSLQVVGQHQLSHQRIDRTSLERWFADAGKFEEWGGIARPRVSAEESALENPHLRIETEVSGVRNTRGLPTGSWPNRCSLTAS